MTHPKPTRDGFLDNFRKLQLNEQHMLKLQIQMTNPSCDRESMLAEKEKVAHELNNMRGIVGRQLTTGIWREPSVFYVNKLSKRRGLENELHLATGETFPDRKSEAIFDLSFSKIVKAFKNS
jgi:hypothetical protein